MQRREALALLGMAGAAQLGAAPSARDQFIGVWKLVREYTTDDEGKEVPAALRQRGHISWDRSGRVWVLLYNEGRPKAEDPRKMTLEEYRETFAGLMTYYGTYEIDEAKQTVTHHLEAAASPSLVGVDLVRNYKFSGNRVTLAFQAPSKLHVVFERLPNA